MSTISSSKPRSKIIKKDVSLRYNYNIISKHKFPDLYLALLEYRKCKNKRVTVLNNLLQIAYNPADIRPDVLKKMLDFRGIVIPDYLENEVYKVKIALGLNDTAQKSSA